jgi:hypothetical protein
MKLLIENFKKYLNEENGAPTGIKVSAFSLMGQFRGDARIFNVETSEVISSKSAKDVEELAAVAVGFLSPNTVAMTIGGEQVPKEMLQDPKKIHQLILSTCAEGCQ